MKARMRDVIFVVVLSAFSVLAQDVGHEREVEKETADKVFKEPGYSPYAGRNFPTMVYWGNQHVHTSISMDAGAIGCKVDDEGGYRFSRGEEITTSTGQRIKLSRPMDWVLISDHAEAYGAVGQLVMGNPILMADPTCKRWRGMIVAGGKEAFDAAWEMIRANSTGKIPPALTNAAVVRSSWERHVKITEKYNEPGRFT